MLLESSTVTLTNLPDDVILVHATNCLGEWGAGIAKAIAEIWPVANEVYAKHCKDAYKGQLEGTCLLIPPQPQNSALSQQRRRQASREDESGGKKEIPKVWIACLFTSYGYGRPTKKKAGKDTKAEIIEFTKLAIRDLKTQIEGTEKTEEMKSDTVKSTTNSDVVVDAKSKEKSRKRKRAGNDNDNEEEGLVDGTRDLGNQAEGLVGTHNEKPALTIFSPKFNSGSFGVPWDQTSTDIETVFKDWTGQWFLLNPA